MIKKDLKVDYTSRKLILFIILLILSTVLMINGCGGATYEQWCNFVLFIFFGYIGGNIGSAYIKRNYNDDKYNNYNNNQIDNDQESA